MSEALDLSVKLVRENSMGIGKKKSEDECGTVHFYVKSHTSVTTFPIWTKIFLDILVIVRKMDQIELQPRILTI